jgi:hypothetical protein
LDGFKILEKILHLINLNTTKMKNVYELRLFEETFLEREPHSPRSQSVRRVPGGWTFTEFYDSQSETNEVSTSISTVFIPYNDLDHPMHNSKPIS